MGETTSAYVVKAKECGFGVTFHERILEHIIQTIDYKKMIEKAISKTWDLTRFLTEASQTGGYCEANERYGKCEYFQ